jgi:hypothetical protein
MIFYKGELDNKTYTTGPALSNGIVERKKVHIIKIYSDTLILSNNPCQAQTPSFNTSLIQKVHHNLLWNNMRIFSYPGAKEFA